MRTMTAAEASRRFADLLGAAEIRAALQLPGGLRTDRARGFYGV
ncbi:hypothetical protein [Streptomonospora salina]|uniref:Uncharacterized protein n=1 Tax=Streptomonospora salina TaxID=104205 RepID=A0A841E5T6_9ACTN|nr:hypothetical protein [Streptomonospora salina]MBB5996669.1 hypothetical protein [Streptomonospora salina]